MIGDTLPGHVNAACDEDGCYCPDDVFWGRLLGDKDPCAPGKNWAAAAFGEVDDAECTTCDGTGLTYRDNARGYLLAEECSDRDGLGVAAKGGCRCQIVGWSRDPYESHIPAQAEWEQADDCPVHPIVGGEQDT